jgi:hypothetical protein
MTDFDEFKALYSLSGQLVEELDKEKVAEVARLLALHVADYQQRYGAIPPSRLLDLLGVTEITQEQAKLLRNGMEVLLGYLGHMRGETDNGVEPPVH